MFVLKLLPSASAPVRIGYHDPGIYYYVGQSLKKTSVPSASKLQKPDNFRIQKGKKKSCARIEKGKLYLRTKQFTTVENCGKKRRSRLGPLFATI